MRRRRISGRRGNKAGEQEALASDRQVPSAPHTMRFYWSSNAYSRQHTRSHAVAVQNLSIRCATRQPPPNAFLAELTLATLISSCMHWLYTYHEKDEP